MAPPLPDKGYPAQQLLPGHDAPLTDPDAIRDHAAILAAAQAAHDRRAEAYPALVERGQLDAAEAAADIAAWAALVAEWRWIITGRGAPPASWTLFDRIDAVDRAADRARLALSRNRRNAELQRQLDLYLAMRWHLSRLRWGDPEVHFMASVGHAHRAALVACPTCERRREDPRTASCTRTDCGLPCPRSADSGPRFAPAEERTAA